MEGEEAEVLDVMSPCCHRYLACKPGLGTSRARALSLGQVGRRLSVETE